MKKPVKRLLVLILALSMILSLQAGCGKSVSAAPGAQDAAPAVSSSAVLETASEAAGSTAENAAAAAAPAEAEKPAETPAAAAEEAKPAQTAAAAAAETAEEAKPAQTAAAAPAEEAEAAEETQAAVSADIILEAEAGLSAEEVAIDPELTEYYDENVTFEIEYTGDAAPSEDREIVVEGSIGETLEEDVKVEEQAMEFAPLSEKEIEGLAEEVRAEIEEAAEEEAQGTAAEEPAEEEGTAQTAGISDNTPALAGTASNKQLTIEDIQAMNPNTTVIDIYTNQGYLSTLVGKYYEGRVTNMEEGVLSIQPMASLLGLSKGCDFFAVYSETNRAGYTFYTYQQRYGGTTLRYATLRIIVDPQGYTAGLSCSFVPNVGTASKEAAITKEQAENIVRQKFSDFNLTFYTDYTVRLAVPFNDTVYNCWVVYTDNPDATPSFDMPYVEHCVTTDGEYLTLIPTNDFATTNSEVQDNSGYFKGMEVKEYSTSFRLEDGSTREITVPISYNKNDNKYYLMDPTRKIAVAQYYDFNYLGTVNFVTSNTIDGWSKNNLMAYANYIIVYDFYLSKGIKSIDGFGVPILITVGWCDKNRTPVNNACFYGVKRGWACFGVSDVNYYSDCVDVVGHEYTHGITNRSMQGIAYRNETGSINESYSDIMGNLAEMSMNYTADRSWKIAERSGATDRDMGNPNAYRQPAYVGDRYYVPAVLYPDFDINDYGGVHVNNSLIGHIAYLMDQAGMSYDQQISMWLTSIELITPLSDYQDLHGALLFSLKINGLLSMYGAPLNQAFAEAGLNEDWSDSYLNSSKEGCGRVSFTTDENIAAAPVCVLFATTQGQVVGNGFPDAKGRVSLLLPSGTYIAQLQILLSDGWRYFNYTGQGWAENGDFGYINVSSGAVYELVGTSGQKSGQSGTGGQQQSDGSVKLTKFDADFFSMLVPEGWNIEVFGEYNYFSIKIYDPNDPSTQLFYFGGLSPYHKSEAARNFWAMYDSTGLFTNGPVLYDHNILGILQCWNYTADYQAYYDRQYFTKLNDFYVRGANYYNGPYAKYNAIESTCVTECTSEWGADCLLTMTSALIDEDIFNVYGGYWFYTCRDLCGILAPKDRYDAVFEDLLTCLTSLTFTQNYIVKSQSTDFPMVPQATITANLNTLASVMYEMHETYK